MICYKTRITCSSRSKQISNSYLNKILLGKIKQTIDNLANVAGETNKVWQEKANTSVQSNSYKENIKEFIQNLQKSDKNIVKIEEDTQFFGKGGFGEVNEVVDLDQMRVRAAKRFFPFNSQSEVQDDPLFQELWIYHQLKSNIKDQKQLRQRVILNDEDFDLNDRVIYFEAGQISLSDLAKEYKMELNINFAPEDLLYFFKSACELVLFLYSENYYHSDIKDDNITLVETDQAGEYKVKFIDMGAASSGIELKAYTRTYFCSPNRHYEGVDKIPVIGNKKERFYAEMFQVFRTLQHLMLPKGLERTFQQAGCGENIIMVTTEHLKQLEQAIQQQYSKELKKSLLLSEILSFTNQKGWVENFSEIELRELLEKIPYTSYKDIHQVISNKVKQRRQSLTDREGVMNKLMGLSVYVPLQCSHNVRYKNRIDLMDKVLQFIKDDPTMAVAENQSRNSILLLQGQSGGGKSLFLIQLIRRLNQLYKTATLKQKYDVIYIKLREFSSDSESFFRYVKKRLEQKVSAVADPVLLLADGFDEYSDTQTHWFDQLESVASSRPWIKVVLTCRENTVLDEDLNQCLRSYTRDQYHSTLYICPFDDKQQTECIKNFVTKGKLLKRSLLECTIEDSAEQYLQYYEKIPVLKELSKVPFTLRMILNSFSVLKEESNQNQGSLSSSSSSSSPAQLSKPDIYRLFIHNYYHNELKRIGEQEEFKEFIQVEFDIEGRTDIFDKQRVTSILFPHIDRYNARLAHYLFGEKKIIFDYDQILQLVNDDSDANVSGKIDLQNDQKKAEFFLRLTPLSKGFSQQSKSNSYLHKSLYEYFMAFGIVDNLNRLASLGSSSQELAEKMKKSQVSVCFQQRPLQEEPQSLQLFQDIFHVAEKSTQSKIRDTLLKLVIASKYFEIETHRNLIQASANAATIANMISFGFIGRDFSSVKIPQADLSNCWLNKTNFENAVLDRVNFSNTCLNDSNLCNASLDGVTFGQISPFKGHTGTILSIVISQDGSRVFSASADKTIKIWNSETGAIIKNLTGHTDKVNSLALNQQETILVSGSSDKSIRVWDVATGQEIKQLSNGNFIQWPVNCIAISPDGLTAISGSDYPTIQCWNIQSGQQVNKMIGHEDAVQSLNYSRSGKVIVSGSEDNSVILWNASTAQIIYQFKQHQQLVLLAKISQSEKKIVSGSADGTIIVWDVDSKLATKTLTGDFGSVYSVAISPDETKIVTGTGSQTILVWDIDSGSLIDELSGHASYVRSVIFSSEGSKIVSGSGDKSIRVWDAYSASSIKSLSGHTDAIWSVAVSADGQKVFSGSWDKTIRVWNTDEGTQINQLIGHSAPVQSLAISRDSQILVSSSEDLTIRIWNAVSGALLQELKGHQQIVWSVAISDDATMIVSGSADLTTRIWDVHSGKLIALLSGGHTGAVLAVAISADSQMVASGSWDQSICLWKTGQAKLIKKLNGHTDVVKSVIFFPDGVQMASGSFDCTIRLWDINRFTVTKVLTGHTDSIQCLTIAAQTRIIFSASSDKSIRIWNMDNGMYIHQLCGHNDYVRSIAASADGKILASTSDDQTIRIWDCSSIIMKCQQSQPKATEQKNKQPEEILNDFENQKQSDAKKSTELTPIRAPFKFFQSNDNFKVGYSSQQSHQAQLELQPNAQKSNTVIEEQQDCVIRIYGKCTQSSMKKMKWIDQQGISPLVRSLIKEETQENM